MQFNLTGFVCDRPAADALSIAVRRMPIVPITADLAFVPVPKHIVTAIRAQTAIADGFRLLNGTLVEAASMASMRGRVVWLEVEFTGGIGAQSAIGWHEGIVVFGPEHAGNANRTAPPLGEWPGNRTLRWLGVERRGNYDEWDSVRLGRHHKVEGWLDERIHESFRPSMR